MKKYRNLIVFLITIIVSAAVGIFFGDIIGGITLAFGFLNAYYSAIGKWQNYIFGILFSFTYAYINFINGLYGFVIFNLIVYLPVQIYGLISWIKTKDENGAVLMKSLKPLSAVLLTVSVMVFSALVGFGLSLIPSQNLPFLDSCSQLVNVGGVVLSSLRFRESWYVWLANNVIDLTIWIINVVYLTESAITMLITSVMYLVMNIIGVIMWGKIEKKQKAENEKIVLKQ